MLLKAVQTVIERGPIDAVTGHCKNTLCEEKLLKLRVNSEQIVSSSNRYSMCICASLWYISQTFYRIIKLYTYLVSSFYYFFQNLKTFILYSLVKHTFADNKYRPERGQWTLLSSQGIGMWYDLTGEEEVLCTNL